MPRRSDTPAGAPIWVDLMTRDQDRARTFYGRLLGWHAEPPNPDFGGYFNFSSDGALVAGCMGSMQPEHPDVWSVYLATDDMDRTLRDATAHGGQVLVGSEPVGDLGRMAVLLDAGGATIGVWQPALHRGFGVVQEPGAPAWFELHSRDYAASVEFYRAVFGWTVRVEADAPDFRYSVFERDGEQHAGIMDASGNLAPDAPPHWMVYFATGNTDAALAEATAMGATVVQAAEDTPYGRIAAVADPTGAVFRLVQDLA